MADRLSGPGTSSPSRPQTAPVGGPDASQSALSPADVERFSSLDSGRSGEPEEIAPGVKPETGKEINRSLRSVEARSGQSASGEAPAGKDGPPGSSATRADRSGTGRSVSVQRPGGAPRTETPEARAPQGASAHGPNESPTRAGAGRPPSGSPAGQAASASGQTARAGEGAAIAPDSKPGSAGDDRSAAFGQRAAGGPAHGEDRGQYGNTVHRGAAGASGTASTPAGAERVAPGAPPGAPADVRQRAGLPGTGGAAAQEPDARAPSGPGGSAEPERSAEAAQPSPDAGQAAAAAATVPPAATDVPAMAPVETSAPASPREISQTLRQMVDRILVSAPDRGEPGAVHIQLRDAFLDGSTVKLSRHEGRLQVEFVAATEDARQFLNNNSQNLSSALGERLGNERVVVTVAGSTAEAQGADGTGTPDDGRSRQRYEPGPEQMSE